MIYNVQMPKKLNQLNELQRYVTQENGTERPFVNEYWNHFEKGLYRDLLSEVPLFLSSHKFESQCGWPSFFDVINKDFIEYIQDNSHGMSRVEVRGKESDAHLGHVFTDGPAPTFYRYCINSAAIEFVSLEDFDEFGLSEYRKFFEDKE